MSSVGQGRNVLRRYSLLEHSAQTLEVLIDIITVMKIITRQFLASHDIPETRMRQDAPLTT